MNRFTFTFVAMAGVVAMLATGAQAHDKKSFGKAGLRGKLHHALKHLDADGDGAISLDEYLAPGLKVFERMDKNGDGAITDDEIPARGGRGNSLLDRLDANGDGKITKDEFTAKAKERFDKVDADGDGLITRDELKGALKGPDGGSSSGGAAGGTTSGGTSSGGTGPVDPDTKPADPADPADPDTKPANPVPDPADPTDPAKDPDAAPVKPDSSNTTTKVQHGIIGTVAVPSSARIAPSLAVPPAAAPSRAAPASPAVPRSSATIPAGPHFIPVSPYAGG